MFEAVFSPFLKTAMLLVAAFAPAMAAGPMTRIVDFSETRDAVTITSDGADVTLQPIRGDGDAIDVSAAIRIPGYEAIIVNEGAQTSPVFERWVGIGRLAASDPAPAVLLAGYSGGAHCCATLKAIVPDAGTLRVVEFEAVDGEPDQTFPQDIDHDGVVDFVRQDDSFRYQFASGAGSFSPPVIYNIYRGQIVDVTTQPGFRPLWEEFARETRSRCADQSEDDRNGACAAYVAAAARLGRYPNAMREVERLARSVDEIRLYEACRVRLVDGACPTGSEIVFHSFPSALTWFLRAHGYID
jgi:hypothetical protein